MIEVCLMIAEALLVDKNHQPNPMITLIEAIGVPRKLHLAMHNSSRHGRRHRSPGGPFGWGHSDHGGGYWGSKFIDDEMGLLYIMT